MLASAIAGKGVAAAYQPVVDLARATIVGYEALARFPDQAVTNPEEWFDAARSYGVADQLEAATMTAAFANRSSLPPNCFLAINVSPNELASPVVQNVLDGQADLAGVVIELTEQTRIDSYLALEPFLNRYRAAGALIAVDDAGSGYAGLQHLISLRPAIIKVDRHFVDGIDQDEAKRALVDMLGAFANRTDAWLLAEGIERPQELDVLANLGVPLAQGYLLGRPAPAWADIEPGPAEQLRSRTTAEQPGTLRDLLESCPSATSLEQAAAVLGSNVGLDIVVVLDHHSRPTAVADAESLSVAMTSDAMRVNLSTPITEAAQRAIGRPPYSRFQPLVCTDNAGRYVGIVRMERLIEQLSRQLSHLSPPSSQGTIVGS
jgi:EAL domain-containing protein (putative c-di-GMP-specific phosphodiesterase class I)